MNRYVRPNSRFRSASRLSTWASTDLSSADTASSRITSRGDSAKARAILTRWRWPPEPEWGLMLNTLRTAIYVNPWVAALPGVMIFAVSICFNLLSDGMRSAMDIRN